MDTSTQMWMWKYGSLSKRPPIELDGETYVFLTVTKADGHFYQRIIGPMQDEGFPIFFIGNAVDDSSRPLGRRYFSVYAAEESAVEIWDEAERRSKTEIESAWQEAYMGHPAIASRLLLQANASDEEKREILALAYLKRAKTSRCIGLHKDSPTFSDLSRADLAYSKKLASGEVPPVALQKDIDDYKHWCDQGSN